MIGCQDGWLERSMQRMDKKRYAIVGLGARSAMYSPSLWEDYRSNAALVGFCDVNDTRMAYFNHIATERYDLMPVPTYHPEDFERMLDEQHVDTVIVTSVDRTHHRYIIRAMEAGRDVIPEKPMTLDAAKC